MTRIVTNKIKILALSLSMGVARGCGVPSRSAFIINPRGRIGQINVSGQSGIKFDSREGLALVNAVKTSDRAGLANVCYDI